MKKRVFCKYSAYVAPATRDIALSTTTEGKHKRVVPIALVRWAILEGVCSKGLTCTQANLLQQRCWG